jgi:hypothetical protein
VSLVLEFRSNIRLANLTSLPLDSTLAMVPLPIKPMAKPPRVVEMQPLPAAIATRALTTRLLPHDVVPFPLAGWAQRPLLRLRRTDSGPPSDRRSSSPLVPPSSEGEEEEDEAAQQRARHVKRHGQGSIVLPPALFDPATPHALRRTRALEERALTLQCKVKKDTPRTWHSYV